MTSDGSVPTPIEEFEITIQLMAQSYEADLFVLAGPITDDLGHRFVDLCPSEPEVRNCILMLTTSGGRP